MPPYCKEYPLIILGAFLSMATGALQPIWALLFAEVIGLYGTYNCAINSGIQNATGDFTSDFFPNQTFNAESIKYGEELCELAQFQKHISFLAGMFCVLGVGNLIGFAGSIGLFGIAGEKLTTRLRKLSFTKLLQLEIAYFDDPMNSTGALATRLASDASKGEFKIVCRMPPKFFHLKVEV